MNPPASECSPNPSCRMHLVLPHDPYLRSLLCYLIAMGACAVIGLAVGLPALLLLRLWQELVRLCRWLRRIRRSRTY